MANQWSTDLVDQEVRKAVEAGMARWSQRFVRTLEKAVPQQDFESPLEAAFYVWWVMVQDSMGLGEALALDHQHTVVARDETYRLDFIVTPNAHMELFDQAQTVGVVVPKIGIELDGHDFHEKTKEQVTKRNRRDRHLTADGWVVFHYSGSEFVRDGEECVTEVMLTALEKFTAARNQIAERLKQ